MSQPLLVLLVLLGHIYLGLSLRVKIRYIVIQTLLLLLASIHLILGTT